jgi:hypothetical protein
LSLGHGRTGGIPPLAALEVSDAVDDVDAALPPEPCTKLLLSAVEEQALARTSATAASTVFVQSSYLTLYSFSLAARAEGDQCKGIGRTKENRSQR